MKKIMTTEEIRNTQKELLKYLYDRCHELDIPCFLAGGTLIGAIRHQGYIPWDDDVDVLMYHEDYKKLVASLKDNINENYELMDFENIPNYNSVIAKLCDKRTKVSEDGVEKQWGVFVDIFFLEGLGKDLNQAIKHVKKANKYRSMFYFSLPNKRFTFNLICIMQWGVFLTCRLIGRKFFYKKLVKLANKYPIKDSKYASAIINGAYGIKEITPTYAFMGTVDVKFEELTCSAPRGYDAYLSNIYGNYMQLPPLEQRKAPHELKAWWK